MLRPERTAVSRKKPSLPARVFAAKTAVPHASVLDWGCGRGADVDWFAELGLYAVGYDPAFRPWVLSGGANNFIRMQYDFITCFYVLNVIPTKKGRVKAIEEAAHHMANDGKMFIAVRSFRAIETNSSKWKRFRDGYKTSRNTFQHGFTNDELEKLIKAAGLCYAPWRRSGFVGCIVTKP